MTIKQIIKREGNLVAYDRDRISTAIFRAMVSVKKEDRALAESIAEQVEKALNDDGESTPSVEEIQDIVGKKLLESGQTDTAQAYTTYRRERAQSRAARSYTFEVTDNIPYKKIYEVLRWNMDHGCESIAGLNRIIESGRFPALVKDSNRRFDEELEACAVRIRERKDRIRMAIVAGPSSSGKTTTTCKLGEKLAAVGLRFKALNVDHYFFDLEKHPRDQFGDYDYETPQALDLALIDEHLSRLVGGGTVKTPHYDFKTGKRRLDVHELRLEAGEILLIDSLHGLYGELTRSIPAERKFKLYIETLGQFRSEDGTFMRWADNRLMRRMIRDSLHRNSDPIATLTHWHYVRRSELKNIIPYIGTADALINSALPYELPILKRRVFHLFPKALETMRTDPHRQDAYIRAKRVQEFLSPLQVVTDDSCVPSDALLREFIGGSRYPV